MSIRQCIAFFWDRFWCRFRRPQEGELREAFRGQHRDLCEIMWSAGEWKLIERIPADAAMTGGDYIYVSPPHSMAICPFKDAGHIRWEKV